MWGSVLWQVPRHQVWLWTCIRARRAGQCTICNNQKFLIRFQWTHSGSARPFPNQRYRPHIFPHVLPLLLFSACFSSQGQREPEKSAKKSEFAFSEIVLTAIESRGNIYISLFTFVVGDGNKINRSKKIFFFLITSLCPFSNLIKSSSHTCIKSLIKI